VSLRIERGTITAIAGLSASGKTTLLGVLGMLWAEDNIPPGSAIYCDGDERVDMAHLGRNQRAALRRRHFGFVLQTAFLLPHFSCLDNLAMPLALQGAPIHDCRQAAKALLDDVGLGQLATKPARQTSGGERQRLAVLRALIHGPRVVFADEPLNNLDFLHSKQIVDLLWRWKGEPAFLRGESGDRTLVLVSHVLDEEVFKSLDQIYVVADGRIVENRPWTPAEFPDGAAGLRRLMFDTRPRR
jgi:ABC-type lipoprotein export system ATPase subunit